MIKKKNNNNRDKFLLEAYSIEEKNMWINGIRKLIDIYKDLDFENKKKIIKKKTLLEKKLIRYTIYLNNEIEKFKNYSSYLYLKNDKCKKKIFNYY
jgi:hypothetical protein